MQCFAITFGVLLIVLRSSCTVDSEENNKENILTRFENWYFEIKINNFY
jgi:hypothetical protein